jgi:hypothetical protein
LIKNTVVKANDMLMRMLIGGVLTLSVAAAQLYAQQAHESPAQTAQPASRPATAEAHPMVFVIHTNDIHTGWFSDAKELAASIEDIDLISGIRPPSRTRNSPKSS